MVIFHLVGGNNNSLIPVIVIPVTIENITQITQCYNSNDNSHLKFP